MAKREKQNSFSLFAVIYQLSSCFGCKDQAQYQADDAQSQCCKCILFILLLYYPVTEHAEEYNRPHTSEHAQQRSERPEYLCHFFLPFFTFQQFCILFFLFCDYTTTHISSQIRSATSTVPYSEKRSKCSLCFPNK